MDTEEKVWDLFTDLDEDEMADMAERALDDVSVFRNVSMDAALEQYNLRISKIVEICEEAINNDDFTTNDCWAIYDNSAETIKSDDDLMELLSDYEDEIVYGIMNDEDLMDELGIATE